MKKSKITKPISKRIAQVLIPLLVLSSSSIGAVKADNVFSDNITMTLIQKNDVVYSATTTSVYSSPYDNADIIGSIPIGWGIDREATTQNGFEKISFDSQDAFIKSKSMSLEQIEFEENYDIVYSNIEELSVYEESNEDSTIVGTIPMGWGIDRKVTLQNGFALVSYDSKDLFIKVDDITTIKPRIKRYLGNFKITFYCTCSKCNGGYGSVNAFGKPLQLGRSSAVDPSIIPLGTDLYIDGIEDRYSDDTGGAIKGYIIDIFLSNHDECMARGVEHRDVYVYE